MTALVVVGVVAQPALAWHPKGVIVKKAVNITAGGSIKDANTAADAVVAKPGDIVRYIIEVRNDAAPAEKQYNDMDFVQMTDKLPAGVELVGSSTRVISENLGLIVPKKKVVKEYDVKVTSTKDGDVITNEACFKGDSIVHDNPQKGCDKAVVKVEVPVKPEEPRKPQPPVTPPQTPEQPAPQMPAALPATGAESFGAAAGVSIVGYVGHLYLRSKRALGKAFRK